ncbi:DUF7577 domain-containing protein [Salinibaculum rarum]|jgi:hypothetical protein|uniref:DUF7577 domain-containing protein n=1 Tax=Salinibaculum rarum TaxID=3058903 RepID=UPI00265E962E|nr:hypothetical protein [Salinibaculum sp. KK48]
MEAWAWLAAYLIGFALLQLVLYRYFQRGESTHDAESRDPGYKRLEGSAAADIDASTERDDAVVCQQCGALNDRDGMFSYCRECAEPLR